MVSYEQEMIPMSQGTTGVKRIESSVVDEMTQSAQREEEERSSQRHVEIASGS